jgi:hypothetical protein
MQSSAILGVIGEVALCLSYVECQGLQRIPCKQSDWDTHTRAQHSASAVLLHVTVLTDGSCGHVTMHFIPI